MNQINCPICAEPLSVRAARGRASNKPFIMLVCPKDGRHLRAFITDKDFVNRILQEGLALSGTDKSSLTGEGTGRR